jgi:hypothetical protein
MKRSELLKLFMDGCDETTRWARQHFTPLDEDQYNWKPHPSVWSIAQCLQHINMTGTHWLKQFEKIPRWKLIEHSSDEFRFGLLSRYLLRLITPETKIKLKASSLFQPHHIITGHFCLEEFYELQDRIKSCVSKLASVDLSAIRLTPPHFSFIRVNAGEAMLLYNRHTWRHLRQALQVKNHPAFPVFSASGNHQ